MNLGGVTSASASLVNATTEEKLEGFIGNSQVESFLAQSYELLVNGLSDIQES
ncbi:MAG: hypothetical protein ACOYMS_05890 [Terrimicrobiaceae bacterium]